MVVAVSDRTGLSGTAQSAGTSGRTGSVALFFCALGLFTLSWDRIGNLAVGTFNLKVSAMAFVLAIIAGGLASQRRHGTGIIRGVVLTAAALIFTLLLASLLSQHVPDALAQVMRTLIGAVAPFAALMVSTRSRDDLVSCLTWLIRGLVVASLFGFYQLSAYYLHLPQFVEYDGLSGGVGRIAAFSYEPATFGQMVLMALAAVLARSVLQHRPLPRVVVAVLVLAAILTNSRALLLTVPAFLVLARPWRISVRGRTTLMVAAVVVGYGALILLVAAPSALDFVTTQFASIFDPNEQSSNARRLGQYAIVFDLIKDNWVFGIGPGNLFYEVSRVDQDVFDGVASNQVVANNIWLQSMADGGIALTLLQGTLIVLVVRSLFFRGPDATRILASAWLALILISGMLGSDFFTPARWVLLAFSCLAFSFETERLGRASRSDEAGNLVVHDPQVKV